MHTVGLPRTCLGFTNLLFFFLGFIGCIICVWCSINPTFFRDVNFTITKSDLVDKIANFVCLKIWLTPLTTILLPFGIASMLTSCCGLLGAGCKVKCALKSYIFLVSIVSCICFWIFFISCVYNVYSDNESTRRTLRLAIQTNYGKENDFFTSVWNHFMVNYECCGVNGLQDFNNSGWSVINVKKRFPVQCCKLQNVTHLIPVSRDCQNGSTDSYHRIGCFDALRQSIIQHKASLVTYIVLILLSYGIVVSFAYIIMRGEPLIGPVGAGGPFVQPKIDEPMVNPSQSSLENMMFAEETPKKVMRVVSVSNPFQAYKLTDSNSMYSNIMNKTNSRKYTDLLFSDSLIKAKPHECLRHRNML